MMREVAIIGAGQTTFGKLPQRSLVDLGHEAALAAIKDAGISPKDIQFFSCGNMYEPMVIGERIASTVGISKIEMVNVNNACTGGHTSLREAWLRVAYGVYDVALALGVESNTTAPFAGKLQGPPADDFEGAMRLSFPGYFALLARRHMEQYGTTKEQLALVSVKNHHNGSLNPYAQYRKELTIEEVLNSRMICDPLTLLECCPNTDGAAAIILCSSNIARRYTTKPVFVAASTQETGDYRFRNPDYIWSELTYRTSHRLYEMAGIGPEDLDFVELHDAFASCEIMHIEEMGLCPRGGGGPFTESGATALGGKIPVNPSGGLLSLGHPLSATGIRQAVDAYRQLRGEAGEMQIPNAKTGMIHTLGGTASLLEAASGAGEILKI